MSLELGTTTLEHLEHYETTDFVAQAREDAEFYREQLEQDEADLGSGLIVDDELLVAPADDALAVSDNDELAVPASDSDESSGAGRQGTKAAVQALLDRFITLKELEADEAVSDTPDWIFEELAAIGYIVSIEGDQKGGGKSTLILQACRDMLHSRPWRDDKATVYTPVVYLTEEGRHSFKGTARDLGLLGHPDFHVLTFDAVAGTPYNTIIEAAYIKMQNVGSKLLVVDSGSHWAQMETAQENSVAAGRTMITPLRKISKTAAVIVVRHLVKPGLTALSIANRGQGNSSISAQLDHIFQLNNPHPDNHSLTDRWLLSQGRYRSHAPTKLYLKMADWGTPNSRYYASEKVPKIINSPRKEEILGIFDHHPEAHTIQDIKGYDERKYNEYLIGVEPDDKVAVRKAGEQYSDAMQEILKSLVADGRLERLVTGKGVPAQWQLASAQRIGLSSTDAALAHAGIVNISSARKAQ